MIANQKTILNSFFGEVNNQSNSPQLDAVSFLKYLFRNCDESGYINIRCFPSKNNLFLPMESLEDIPYFLEANQDQDIYFGVALREWNNGTKDGITEIPALFIDLDIYKLSNEEKEESFQRYKDFPLKANFEINSGGGRYLIWMLKEPTKEDISLIENLNERLISYFHADPLAKDASRIIRLPQTINHKYVHKPLCTVESFHLENEYSLEDFDSILPELESTNESVTSSWESLHFTLDGGPERWLEQALSVAKVGIRNKVGTDLFRRLRDSGLPLKDAAYFAQLYGKRVPESGKSYDAKQAIRSLKSIYRKKTDISYINQIVGHFCPSVYHNNVNKKAYTRTNLTIRYSPTCRQGTLKVMDAEGDSNISINFPADCHLWNCEGPRCGPRNAKYWKKVIDLNYGGSAYVAVISESEIGSWEKAAKQRGKKVIDKEKAKTFILWNGEFKNYLFISNVLLHTREKELILISGDDYSTLINIYLQTEKESLRGKYKIRHSQNILFPTSEYSDGDFAEKAKRVVVHFYNRMEYVNELEVDEGARIVNDESEDFTVIESSQKLINTYRAKANGKLSPTFNSEDADNPLYRGKVIRDGRIV